MHDGPAFINVPLSALCVVAILASAYALLAVRNQKIVVTGEEIASTTWYGRRRTFRWSDVDHFQMGCIAVTCFGAEGKRLFRLEFPAKNGDIFQADIQRRGLEICPYVGKR